MSHRNIEVTVFRNRSYDASRYAAIKNDDSQAALMTIIDVFMFIELYHREMSMHIMKWQIYNVHLFRYSRHSL